MAGRPDSIKPEWLTPQQAASVDRLFRRLREIKRALSARKKKGGEACRS